MNDTNGLELTVTTDGITVEKRYETDAFAVPAVAFRFQSDRDDEAQVRLTDTIPPDVPAEDVGFHPDYGNDHWAIEDDTVVFERRFGPNEAYETVYAIRTSEHDPETFMTDPALDVRDAGDGTETGDATPDSDAATGDGVEAESRSTDHETAGMATPSAGVGAALAAEIREGTLGEEDRALLETELTGEKGSSDVRISHLQSRISDLEAYTDALEAFFDENGTARQHIDETTARLETLEAGLDDVAEQTNETEATVAAFESRIEKTEDDISAIDKAVADVQGDLDELRESVEELRTDVAEIEDWQGRVSSVFGGAADADDGSEDG